MYNKFINQWDIKTRILAVIIVVVILLLGKVSGILANVTLGYAFIIVALLVWWIFIEDSKNKSKKIELVIEKNIQAVAQKFNLTYKPVSAPRYAPLFESSGLADSPLADDKPSDNSMNSGIEGLFTAKYNATETSDIKYFISGKIDGQFLEGFIQKAKLDFGTGAESGKYFVSQIDVDKVFSDIKFFVTPKSREKGITGLIRRFYQASIITQLQGDYRQMTTESPNFNKLYSIWISKHNKYDEKIIYQILTPEFINIILTYAEPLYFEMIYDRLRIYHRIDKLSDYNIEKILKMVAHMKNNITRRISTTR